MTKAAEAAQRWFELTRQVDIARHEAERAVTRVNTLRMELEKAERDCLSTVGSNIPVKVVPIPGMSYVVIITHEKRVTLHEVEETE